jgi:hypothetical protein
VSGIEKKNNPPYLQKVREKSFTRGGSKPALQTDLSPREEQNHPLSSASQGPGVDKKRAVNERVIREFLKERLNRPCKIVTLRGNERTVPRSRHVWKTAPDGTQYLAKEPYVPSERLMDALYAHMRQATQRPPGPERVTTEEEKRVQSTVRQQKSRALDRKAREELRRELEDASKRVPYRRSQDSQEYRKAILAAQTPVLEKFLASKDPHQRKAAEKLKAQRDKRKAVKNKNHS